MLSSNENQNYCSLFVISSAFYYFQTTYAYQHNTIQSSYSYNQSLTLTYSISFFCMFCFLFNLALKTCILSV